MKKIYLISLIAFLFIKTANAQSTSLRGLYINNFDAILGQTVKEDSLLQYALDSSFNYIALYDLSSFNLHNTSTADMLAAFIKRARENYGVHYVGAVGESYSEFQNDFGPYNTNRSDDNERFNVFNLEFEFWTTSSVTTGGYYCTKYLQQANCSCDSSGGFRFFIKQMHQIDSLAAVQQILSETYLGWFNQGQASQIQQNVNRILLHAYRTGQSSVYSYSTTRLQYLASNNSSIDIAPIFSSEPSFMGPWLNTHAQEAAYDQYQTDYNNDNSSWKQYINIIGYQWFDWGYMPKPVAGTFSPAITSSGPLSICSGDSVVLSASVGDSYSWTTGATTRSITVTGNGNYSCDVTIGGVTNPTPAKTITVHAIPSVSITQGNFSAGQVLLSSSATPGSGTVSAYKWKLNNTSINGATASSFGVVTTGNYSVQVTNSNGCVKNSNILNVIISGSNCAASTPTGLSSTRQNDQSQLLSWNAGQTGDSIVVKYQPAGAGNNFNYIRMLNIGQSQVGLTGLQPITTYNWMMYTVCGGSQGSSSTTESFTTGGFGTGIALIPHAESDDNYQGINTYSVYPNPANNKIQIEFNSDVAGKYEVRCMDLNSRIIYSEKMILNKGTNKYSFDISACENGIYFLSLNTDRQVLVKKIIVEH